MHAVWRARDFVNTALDTLEASVMSLSFSQNTPKNSHRRSNEKRDKFDIWSTMFSSFSSPVATASAIVTVTSDNDYDVNVSLSESSSSASAVLTNKLRVLWQSQSQQARSQTQSVTAVDATTASIRARQQQLATSYAHRNALKRARKDGSARDITTNKLVYNTATGTYTNKTITKKNVKGNNRSVKRRYNVVFEHFAFLLRADELPLRCQVMRKSLTQLSSQSSAGTSERQNALSSDFFGPAHGAYALPMWSGLSDDTTERYPLQSDLYVVPSQSHFNNSSAGSSRISTPSQSQTHSNTYSNDDILANKRAAAEAAAVAAEAVAAKAAARAAATAAFATAPGPVAFAGSLLPMNANMNADSKSASNRSSVGGIVSATIAAAHGVLVVGDPAASGLGAPRAPRLLRLTHRWRVRGALADVARPPWFPLHKAAPAVAQSTATNNGSDVDRGSSLGVGIEVLALCDRWLGAEAAAVAAAGEAGARAPGLDVSTDEYGVLKAQQHQHQHSSLGSALREKLYLDLPPLHRPSGSTVLNATNTSLFSAMTRSQCLAYLSAHSRSLALAATRPPSLHAAARPYCVAAHSHLSPTAAHSYSQSQSRFGDSATMAVVKAGAQCSQGALIHLHAQGR